ncbi:MULTISPECIES: peptidylprolyl isomerase [Prauserella salsuginis group]|uniref:Peptidyl-prolyl cis-trans isomerase n=2 Tax=Prauserella salsuginis group TaxID=2893672 RepID=A0A839XSM9_9PSEU|nr:MULTISPECIES: peptidylprolyl isomerase [Prauserella salsuginis group]MBB3665731.1 peptidyl-prolyl cis-trans isomerase B (cyclophilin B) [Prauserella sediminis]MCR3723109.1 peptidyl-prolyl cis-trans isomerase B (cyclophilin B) [Prauserella flava]MCR3732516.1 peptidyl-prolyl cis-trans isomerase B (cyclophilin B) [Prauserella salsuginis]
MGTNQQRREAAKRKLDRQLARRAERAKRRKIIGIGAAVGVVVLAAGLIVVFTGQDEDEGAANAQGEASSSAAPSEDVSIPTQRVEPVERSEPLPNPTTCEYPDSGQAAKQVDAPNGQNVSSKGTVDITLSSTVGDIPVTLDRSLAPCAVNSFESLVEQDYYTDTACHRLGTEGLQMLQCGDPTGQGSGGPGYTFADETHQGLKYGRGILAMANAGPDTNGSQFFMVYGEAELPPDYTVFGSISDEGLKVLDEVARAGHDGSLDPSPGGGKPNTEVRFTDVSING